MSLYDIDTEDQCWARIDELLDLTQRARESRTKAALAALKNRLKEYYDLGNTNRGKDRMSSVEQTLFWPSVSEAYVHAPRLNSTKTWSAGLSEVEYKLKKYRDF